VRPILFHLPLPDFAMPLAWLPLFFALLFAVVGVRKLFGKKINHQEAGMAGICFLLCLLIRFTVMGENTATINLGNYPIYSYGAMLLSSFSVGWFLTLGLAERDGLSRSKMGNNYIVTAVVAIIGARLLYVVTNLEQFNTVSAMLSPRSGLVAYGGFVGGLAGSWIFLRAHRLPLLPWGDVVAPSLAAGLMITRIGCYLFGCDFGMPLSVNAPAFLQKLGSFPHWPDELGLGRGAPAWLQHVQQRGLANTAAHSLPVHPTQLYESLVGASLLVLLLVARKYQKFSGQVFLLFIFCYGMARYLLEIFRDDPDRGSLPFSLPEQLLHPLILILLALAFVMGISRTIGHKPLRLAAQVVSFAPALLACAGLGPNPVQLSTSQLIALLSAITAASIFRVKIDQTI